MTIERHPLLAAGAGQSERMLPDDAVVSYCDTLGNRLGWLSNALEHEQTAGRLSIAAYQATKTFLHEIRATLMVLALKNGRQLLQVEPAPLTIDPTESGMPTFKEFWTLHEDRDLAEGQLAQIPSRERLLEDAVDDIFNGRRPVKQQILWLQRAYMERLAATPVVADFRLMEPAQIGTTPADRAIVQSWTGVIRSVNLFECVTFHFTKRGNQNLNNLADLHSLIESAAGGRNSLQEMLGLFNEAAQIVPRTIERVTIGPYLHKWTENDDLTRGAFGAAPGGDAFLLRAGIERAATTRSLKRSMMDVVFGREPMEAGPSLRYRVLLVPLALKQVLGDADEDNQPAAVYGVTDEGYLVP